MKSFILKENDAAYRAKKLMANGTGQVNDIEVICELLKLSRDNCDPIQFIRWDRKLINGKQISEKHTIDRETMELSLMRDFNIDFRPRT